MGFDGPISKRQINKLINLKPLTNMYASFFFFFKDREPKKKPKLQAMGSFIFFLHFRKGATVKNKPQRSKKNGVDVAILSVGQATKTIKRLLGDALLFFELVGETR